MKVKEMSWFQKGSFSDMDSVPTRVLRLGLSDRSLTWLVLAPIALYWLHSARLTTLLASSPGICQLLGVTMPLSTQSQGDAEQYVLVASLDNARNLSNILKAITFKDHAIFSATPNGLKVTVEDSKCLQANAFIQSEIFQEYTIKEDSVGFQVNLTVLLDCLNIFGGSTAPGVRLPSDPVPGGGGVVTVCKINTQEPEEPVDFEFCSTNVTNKVILQSESLKEAFSELDMTSEVLEITMSPSQPYFRLSTFGNSGSAHYDYPKDSDMMELFKCTTTQTNRYKMSLLKPSTKALALSCKVSVRTDSRGFLSLQYLVRNDDGQICFVEYYCCPDEEVAED
ncbi:hypothetical protein F7725_015496 [Dissostichus mawsoni]|uniref:Cell cycle checkpoint protein RAD1 n=1 Tax=Dissostichus mawsoni TaxID=36200 RepID=A0A7J5YJR3_DISMA|nr:hypothetical protein F7725_015496 [Dissostichus mawsoni]